MLKFVAIVLVIAVVSGGAFLATWEIPAPSEQVERTIPNDRFPR